MNIKKYLMAVGILVTALQLNAAEEQVSPTLQRPAHRESDAQAVDVAFADEAEGLELQQEVASYIEIDNQEALRGLLSKHMASPYLKKIVNGGLVQAAKLTLAEKQLGEVEQQDIAQIRKVIESREKDINIGNMIDKASGAIPKKVISDQFKSLPRGQKFLKKAEGLQKELEELRAQVSVTRPADEIGKQAMPPEPSKQLKEAELSELAEVRHRFKMVKELYISSLKRGSSCGEVTFNRYIKIIQEKREIALKYQEYEQGKELIQEADELIQELTNFSPELQNNTQVSRPYLVGGIVATVAVVAAVIVYLLYNKKPATV